MAGSQHRDMARSAAISASHSMEAKGTEYRIAAYTANGIGRLTSLMHYSRLRTQGRIMQAVCSQHLSIIKRFQRDCMCM